jgi:Domain of unknown function (DUF5753)
MVELRMRRQQRLGEDTFQGLAAVMTEGVIRTLVGGRDIMCDQLRHLIEMTQRYPVVVHILPFTAGALPGSDNIVIFGFDPELDGDVVYVDSETAQRMYEDRNPVRQCTYIFNAALALALPARESQDPCNHQGAVTMVIRTSNPYPLLDDAEYDAVVNGRYLKSAVSGPSTGCLSFTVVGGLIGFQDDKLSPAERKARTLIFDQREMAAFIAGAKNGDFDHLLD